MTGLEPVKGEYRLYVKTIAADTCQAYFWKMAPAFTCAVMLSREQDVFVTESVTLGKAAEKVSRIYHFPKGGGMPELMAHVPETRTGASTNGRKLELEVRG